MIATSTISDRRCTPATAQGDTSFANDQTWIKAILSHDGGPRHPGAFAVADQLVVA